MISLPLPLYTPAYFGQLTCLTGAHVEESPVQTVGGAEPFVVGIYSSVGHVRVRGCVPPQSEAMRICHLLCKHALNRSVIK